MADKLQFLNNLIKTHKLLIIEKSTCPYCIKVNNLFKNLNVQPFILYLDNRDDGSVLQSTLKSITNVSTVPQVFINEKFIGGCDDTHKLHNKGELTPLLLGAGLTPEN